MQTPDKPRILVVEDNRDQAFVIRYFLKNKGYQVDWCSTPQSSLKSAQSKAYDLVLLDIMLNAEEDGFSLCRKFKESRQLRDIPIIMVTARTAPRDKISGLDLGADDYVTKPFNREELASRIKAVLKRRIYQDLTHRYHELIENNNDLVLFLNTSGQIEHTNKRAESTLPHLVATDHQLDFVELFEETDADEISTALYRALDGEDITAQKWKLSDTEEKVTVNAQMIPLRHGNRIIGIGCILRDASREEKMFRQLEQNTGELRRKIETTSAALSDAQQKLVMSEKMAAMGQLGAGIAHVFRNPLNTITASLYILRKKSDLSDSLIKRHLDLIEEEVERSKRLIENLLDFAKKSKAKRSKVDVNRILDQIPALLAKDLKLFSIKIVKDYNNIKPAYINQDDLKQILLNLILNAKDAMPNGGTLTLRTAMEDNKVVVFISDSGRGIPEPDVDKIFEPFYTRKEEKGVGIGLSLVHSAIERNSGSIDVTSQVNKGTTFALHFPVFKGDNEDDFIQTRGLRG